MCVTFRPVSVVIIDEENGEVPVQSDGENDGDSFCNSASIDDCDGKVYGTVQPRLISLHLELYDCEGEVYWRVQSRLIPFRLKLYDCDGEIYWGVQSRLIPFHLKLYDCDGEIYWMIESHGLNYLYRS